MLDNKLHRTMRNNRRQAIENNPNNANNKNSPEKNSPKKTPVKNQAYKNVESILKKQIEGGSGNSGSTMSYPKPALGKKEPSLIKPIIPRAASSGNPNGQSAGIELAAPSAQDQAKL